MAGLQSQLRQWRQRRRLTQRELARLAGVTRQTISGLESGLYGPGVEVGLRLARALRCRVDDLFTLADEPIEAAVAGRAPSPKERVRVALAEVDGRTVARPLTGLGADRWSAAAAHGLAQRSATDATVRVHRLAATGPALFLAGCDPALGLLAAHVRRLPGGMDALWWHAGNAGAAEQLARREVHAAGIHDPGAGDAPARQPLVRFRVARWRMGWLSAPAGRGRIRDASDLGRGDLRLANREAGAGARALLDRLLAEAGVAGARVPGYDHSFPGHGPVADAIALGAADVGIGMEAAAAGRGLDFVPLTEEVCDLWLTADSLDEAPVAAALEALHSGAFRADLSAFGPYDTSETGDRIA